MKKYTPYVGGEFIPTNNSYNVTCPWDKQVVADVDLAGTEQLELAISKAEKAKELMANLPSFKRYEILMDIATKIKERRNELANILSLEAGKPLKLALGEVDRAIQVFVVAAEESKRLPSEIIQIDWTPAGEGKEGIVKYFPIGLIAGISPFNFPLNLSVHKIAPAIASGCPIILKPARSTPMSALILAEIIDTTALPKGAFSVLPMDRLAGNQLVTDERFAMLSFTGSPQVGWKMKNQAGRKKVVLELGGNAGVVIAPSSNIDIAISKCVTGAFAYSGQVCIHTQRIFVHTSIFDKFIEGFVASTSKMKQGHPSDSNTDISAMIDEENAIRVEKWIKESVEQGAKILYGGNRDGCFVQPTIITNTTQDMKVCAMEVFGPVVVIEPYEIFGDAIKFINSSEYGLQAGVFTNQIDEMNQAYSKLEVGGVIINDVPTFRVDHMPYGGVKNSGLGREGVKYAIFEMLEPKLLVKNSI
ncbi:MAG: aldehyde dehydrogenase family protein [Bacteroidales bacterium]|nr:MAG: aldehyde dehydrogenase family protein [Bacteroidales bacterium]